MLRDFIAIDFETANQERSSVCSVGVVMVRDGHVVDSFYSLIQPEPNCCTPWLLPAATTYSIITMRWLTPKPVPPSH